MNIKTILRNANLKLKENIVEDCNFKSRILLSNILNKSKEYLIIHDEEELNEKVVNEFNEKIDRLIKGEPLQYIIEKQEFMGLDFFVNSDVLIPQPDTEILVQEVIEKMKSLKVKTLKVLDLCTGSGAIGVSIKKILQENAKVWALDISSKALEVAKINALKNDANIEFLESNLFSKVPQDLKFDIIVSNPPYIETNVISELSKEVRNEPNLALDGGIDGLDFYRKISKEAKNFLNENGILAFEIGYNQKENVEKIMQYLGYKNIYSKKDFAGNDRIVVGNL